MKQLQYPLDMLFWTYSLDSNTSHHRPKLGNTWCVLRFNLQHSWRPQPTQIIAATTTIHNCRRAIIAIIIISIIWKQAKPPVAVQLTLMLLIGKLLTLVLHVSSCFGFYTPYQASKTLLSGRKSECSLTVLFGNTVLSNSIQVSSAAATSNEKPPINERKNPHFPGAVPINATDIQTLIHQTNQASPASAIIGKPATCQCIHGYTQAFSLDPIPMAGNRLNSGLLKLTCPLLVNAIDALEDDGFIAKINEKLQK